ncbi:Putative transposable element, partial [Caligus rogercresseyi]
EYQKRLPDAEAGICDCLGAVASNGKKSPLFQILDGVKVNKIVYLDFLKTKVFPWIQEEFSGVPVCIQQDGSPTHTAKNVQDWCADNFYHFWSKELWPLSSPDCNPLDLVMQGM